MARKKKHEEHEGHANHERWVLSYADILTLLLALFIVMFAISKVDQKKFEEFSRGTAASFGQANLAMQGQTGTLDGTDGIMSDQKSGQEEKAPADESAAEAPMSAQAALQREKAKAEAAAAAKASLEKLRDKLAKDLAAKGLSNAVQMEINERGLVVNIITDRVLFDSGQATLRSEGLKVLDTIAPVVKSLPNIIAVEGHTDNVPISGSFPSNWELSAIRATTVLRQLVQDGVNGKNISAAGYADEKPLASNTSDAGRARNRRVAIVVLPTTPIDGSAAPAATTKTGTTPTTIPMPSVSPSVTAP